MIIIPENLNSANTLFLGYFLALISNVGTYYAGQFLVNMRHAQPHFKSRVPWLLLIYLCPAFILPFFLIPFAVGNFTLLISMFMGGQLAFSVIYLSAIFVQKNRAGGKRRFAKWFYFIPLWIFLIPAAIIGWFITSAYHAEASYLRIGNLTSVIMGVVFYYISVRMPVIDLGEQAEPRRIKWYVHIPVLLMSVSILGIAEFALPLFIGKKTEIFLLFSLSLYGIACTHLAGVLLVTNPKKL